jgi:hypothetical protein
MEKSLYQFRFDKNFNLDLLAQNNLKLIKREGLVATVEGLFFDVIQLLSYPFVKDMKEVK